MESLIDEKKKYEKLWSDKDYESFSPGEHLWGCFEPLIEKGKCLIDFGCGSGKSIHQYLALDLQVQLVDIASNCLSSQAQFSMNLAPDQIQFHEACLWDLPDALKPAEYMVCVDVMEHIPPHKVDDTLQSMAEKHLGLGFFAICLVPDNWGEAINETLHLSLFSPEEWLERINQHWKIARYELIIEDQYLLVFVEAHSADSLSKTI
ncbi:methyltransferase domain-containing protein [Simkania sp.]|uniref:methyltransferase domain-containing protein n=1 Tax=Simkania sp. TaxID=34094 RepID=UPI003B517016